MYKQQAPLQPPSFISSTSIQSVTSPRFDDIMGRSSALPWSPAALDNSRPELKTADTHTKTYDRWPSNNTPSRTNDMQWPSNNPPSKTNDMQWPSNNASSKTNDMQWSSNNTYPKTSEVWSPNNNPYSKPMDTTTVSNDSSNVRMIKSSDKTFGSKADCCSSRCKLGLLGFTIGILAVGIGLAVVLVLWLRK